MKARFWSNSRSATVREGGKKSADFYAVCSKSAPNVKFRNSKFLNPWIPTRGGGRE